MRVDRRPLTSEVVSNCDPCEQLDDREAAREMTAERLVLFVKDPSQEQVVVNHQIDKEGILCVA